MFRSGTVEAVLGTSMQGSGSQKAKGPPDFQRAFHITYG
jgi:hypothetical protein